jgi:hypothetical protein
MAGGEVRSLRSYLLLRRQAGIDVREGVACPDAAVEIRDAPTTLRYRHITVERRPIGHDTNRRGPVGNSLRPGQVGASGYPRLIIGDGVVVRAVQHDNATKKRWRDGNRPKFGTRRSVGADGVANDRVVVGRKSR